MITNKAIKAWYLKASRSDTEYQLACSAYQNAIDTFGTENHPDFWHVVWDSREILLNSSMETYRLVDDQ